MYAVGDLKPRLDVWGLRRRVYFSWRCAVLCRCTRRRIASDFPNVHAWMQDVWLLPCSGTLQVCMAMRLGKKKVPPC